MRVDIFSIILKDLTAALYIRLDGVELAAGAIVTVAAGALKKDFGVANPFHHYIQR